ncbi:MAG TPA: ABC transporter ATP-binding protein [Conexibacter sp.]|nr:ABC transporter ATP-binding protein [Conexibacter sp.]
MLELREVRKHYAGPSGETIRAVDGVSLTVAAGELVALYGPSGSGKSTVLFLAAGIAQPDSGAVLFQGRDLGRLSRRDAARHRRSALGFVFQSPRLVPGLTAVDNAALKLMAEGASRNTARRRVAPLLDLLGLAGRTDQPAALLSHGERQRVALARALANEPRLVLADEPTGSLDSRRGREVLALLSSVCRERDIGVLLVTHDAAGAAYADRVHTLSDGRLAPHVADGAAAPRDAATPQ